ncbi:MAG: hypothetical protein IKY94_15250 [Lachnospiraceae bacterium]|nr:hypothetical protein [Lachnospiraceae bacterium]
MKFGVREICDVVFKATATQKLGSRTFYKDEPVLYFDTLKTSSLDGAATTVYATGGRGNAQLVAWEGERTLTFVMEDALISPEGFAILSGADLIEATADKPIIQHMTGTFEIKQKNTIDVKETVSQHKDAEVFVMALNEFNEIIGEPMVGKAEGSVITVETEGECLAAGRYAFVDYYVERKAGAQQIEITPDKFGGYYYVEASTLFRREADGVDMPAEFVIPKAKVQSNFSFAMASSGDPSTFTFTLDAFPGYLKFDRSKQVLAAIQIIEDMETGEGAGAGSRTENVCPKEEQAEQVNP